MADTRKKLNSEQQFTLFSALPKLHTKSNFHTKHPSDSKFRLNVVQVQDWTRFTEEIRQQTSSFFQGQRRSRAQTEEDSYGAGNETGVQGRYSQQIGEVMSRIFLDLGLKMRIADFQFGVHRTASKVRGATRKGARKSRGKSKRAPDLVIVEDESNGICVVGEIKAPWTFSPKKGESWEQFLARKFGKETNSPMYSVDKQTSDLPICT